MTHQTNSWIAPSQPIDWNRTALFLDFDGTMVPIVDHPDGVQLALETRDLLSMLIEATGGAVAFLSGRAVESLERHADIPGIWMSGSHGLEIRNPNGQVTQQGDQSALDAPYHALTPLAEAHGLLIERKPGAVALHYRQKPELAETCRKAVDLVSNAPLRAVHGHMVSEVGLHGTDKGTALRHILSQPPFRDRRPVMIGDDTTDEDGFIAAQNLGGFGIRIGTTQTRAAFCVPTLWDAHAYLLSTLH